MPFDRRHPESGSTRSGVGRDEPARAAAAGGGFRISTAGRGEPHRRAAGILGQLPRGRGQTPGLPPRGADAGDGGYVLERAGRSRRDGARSFSRAAGSVVRMGPTTAVAGDRGGREARLTPRGRRPGCCSPRRPEPEIPWPPWAGPTSPADVGWG